MSSHWEWAEEIWAKHETEKPFAPENGQPLKFKAGDRVIYTNDAGVEFEQTVTGLYPRKEGDSMYASGRRYLLDTDCHWMPVREDSLRINERRTRLDNEGWGAF